MSDYTSLPAGVVLHSTRGMASCHCGAHIRSQANAKANVRLHVDNDAGV